MKKSIIIACLCLCSSIANAQFWVGGQISSTKGKNTSIPGNTVKTRSFKFLPEVGYAFNNDWEVAVRIGIDYSKAKFSSDKSKARSAFIIEPYARYNVCNLGKNVSFFLDGGIGIENGDFFHKGEYYKSETMFGAGIRPGIKYRATNKMTLVATFGGLGVNIIDKNTDAGFNLNGNSLTIGCYFDL